jgi:ribosomal protein S18 acetylase RimI-like enzyme
MLRVYGATREAELALTGWDAAAREAFVTMQFNAQSSYYRQQWSASVDSVIEYSPGAERHGVGRLWVDHRADAVHLLDIAVLPEWRGKGIGSVCLNRLMRGAARAGKELSIHVELDNPARRLYDRLGFVSIGPVQGRHQLMAWREPTELPETEASYEQA